MNRKNFILFTGISLLICLISISCNKNNQDSSIISEETRDSFETDIIKTAFLPYIKFLKINTECDIKLNVDSIIKNEFHLFSIDSILITKNDFRVNISKDGKSITFFGKVFNHSIMYQSYERYIITHNYNDKYRYLYQVNFFSGSGEEINFDQLDGCWYLDEELHFLGGIALYNHNIIVLVNSKNKEINYEVYQNRIYTISDIHKLLNKKVDAKAFVEVHRCKNILELYNYEKSLIYLPLFGLDWR